MKKSFKQALVPLAVMVFGAVAAFASNAVKTSSSPMAEVPGYLYDQDAKKCIEHVMCSTIVSSVCRNAANQQVFGLNNSSDLTVCTWQLYKIQ